MKFAVSFAFAAALLLALILVPEARAAEPQPGWWEVKIKSTSPSGPHEVVNNNCIKPEHTKNIATGFSPAQNPGTSCTQVNYKWDGTTLSFQIRCDLQGNKSEGEMVYVFDTPTHYMATMKNKISVRGQSIVTTMTMEGRRVADCPKS